MLQAVLAPSAEPNAYRARPCASIPAASKCSLIPSTCQSYFDPGFNLSKSLCSGTSAMAKQAGGTGAKGILPGWCDHHHARTVSVSPRLYGNDQAIAAVISWAA